MAIKKHMKQQISTNFLFGHLHFKLEKFEYHNFVFGFQNK